MTTPAANKPDVTLVIPVRNGERTIAACLDAVKAIRDAPGSPLKQIIVVDDQSTDTTADLVRAAGVSLIEGDGKGPGAARNIGWRACKTPLVWFVDADCVASPDALARLLPAFDDPDTAGSGGSYDNALPNSMLATLIHEEIVTRHERMGETVNMLATFNVAYRRTVLDALGGFDPSFRKAQDAELAYRVVEDGHTLRFNRASRVAHHHPVSLLAYLRTQSHQGYYRVFLHLRHRAPAAGDSYSSAGDHLQPFVAVCTAITLPLAFLATWRFVPACFASLLAVMQLPMALAILTRTNKPAHLLFVPMSSVRAFARAGGMVAAVLKRAAQGRTALEGASA